jgi:hypothetical protein
MDGKRKLIGFGLNNNAFTSQYAKQMSVIDEIGRFSNKLVFAHFIRASICFEVLCKHTNTIHLKNRYSDRIFNPGPSEYNAEVVIYVFPGLRHPVKGELLRTYNLKGIINV